MKAFGEPQIVKFGTGNKCGYTLVQLIETSNICAHFVEEDNSFYLDVFSCKEFNEKDVKDVILQYFQPHNIDSQTIIRQAKPLTPIQKLQ